MAEKDIEIISISIKVSEKQEVKVSVEEAKELYKLLNEMFAEKVLTIPQPYPVPQPLPYYSWPWRYQDTTWTSSSGIANYCSDTNNLTLTVNGDTQS